MGINVKILARLKLRDRATAAAKEKLARTSSQTAPSSATIDIVQCAIAPARTAQTAPRLFVRKSKSAPPLLPSRALVKLRAASSAIKLASQAIRVHARLKNRKSTPSRTTIRSAGVHELQNLLRSESEANNAVLVALDTERERHGLTHRVVEIGVSTLELSDVVGVPPGENLQTWLPRIKHWHIVIDDTYRVRKRVNTSLFSRSKLMSSGEAVSAIKSILQEVSRASEAHGASEEAALSAKTLYLVGHNLEIDIKALRTGQTRLNLLSPTHVGGAKFEAKFDTFDLSKHARSSGAKVPSARLAALTRWLGALPEYHQSGGAFLRGTHNANNDSAYTMMALLLYGLRWQELVKETCPVPETYVRPVAVVWPSSLSQALSRTGSLIERWAKKLLRFAN